MPDWAWVALGYLLAYSTLGAYLVTLRVRQSRIRRHLRGH